MIDFKVCLTCLLTNKDNDNTQITIEKENDHVQINVR